MTLFSQKGIEIDEKNVEEITSKKGKTLFRRKDNKTFVKVLTVWKGEFYVKFSYRSQDMPSKNRLFDVIFETISKHKLKDADIKKLAEQIIERKVEWFDFWNRVEIGEAKQTEEKIKIKKDILEGEYEIESESAKDLHGW